MCVVTPTFAPRVTHWGAVTGSPSTHPPGGGGARHTQAETHAQTHAPPRQGRCTHTHARRDRPAPRPSCPRRRGTRPRLRPPAGRFRHTPRATAAWRPACLDRESRGCAGAHAPAPAPPHLAHGPASRGPNKPAPDLSSGTGRLSCGPCMWSPPPLPPPPRWLPVANSCSHARAAPAGRDPQGKKRLVSDLQASAVIVCARVLPRGPPFPFSRGHPSHRSPELQAFFLGAGLQAGAVPCPAPNQGSCARRGLGTPAALSRVFADLSYTELGQSRVGAMSTALASRGVTEPKGSAGVPTELYGSTK